MLPLCLALAGGGELVKGATAPVSQNGNVAVTAVQGGGYISADTTGGRFTTLTGPKIAEVDKTGIGVGSIVLTAPDGFEFNPSASVTVSVTGKSKGTDLVLSSTVATVTTNSVTIVVTAPSANQRKSILTWSGIQVRPTSGSPLASGHITRDGTSVFVESASKSDYGLLSEVPGAVSNLAVVLPGQTLTSGTGVSGTPVTQVAGVPFNISKIAATDPFLNSVTNYAGVRTVQYFGPSGTPSFTTNVSFTNGQSTTTLATTLNAAETTTIRVSDGVITGAPSSSFVVSGGSFAKLQVLLPGETAAPGTLTGKTGVPVDPVAGVSFPVVVRAVDVYWNPVNTVGDTVGITLSDPHASVPDNVTLHGGTGTFSVVLLTAGSQTITIADQTTPVIPSAVSSPFTVRPGPFQKLQLLVPGETADPGSIEGRTGIPSDHVAGEAFPITVNAVDERWNVVPGVVDFVGITASDSSAILPAHVALTNGSQVFEVGFKRQGGAILTAQDLSNTAITNDSSPVLAIHAGPYAKLQLLVPGEIAAPATATGKTGTPWPQSVGVDFPITVNAVDDYWNRVGTVTNLMHFAASDPLAGAPADSSLVDGTGTFSAVLGSVGSQTLSVTDLSGGAGISATSAVIRAGVAGFDPLTGGESISADSTGASYTPLSGPVITEGAPGNIGAGTIVFTAPSGFLINTGSTVVVTVTGKGEGSDLVLASPTATVSATSVAIEVITPATGSRTSTLTWSGIAVRPQQGFPLAGGSLFNTGTAVISGVPEGTPWGTLTEIPGVANRLTVRTQPSAMVTAGVPFPRQPVVRIEDQFGNLCDADESTVVTVSRGAGTGTLQGTLSAISLHGEASFASLAHCVAGLVTLEFSAPGLLGATSDGILVGPAQASLLTFSQSPTGAVAGVALAPAVAVRVLDGFSNAVSAAGVSVSIQVASGTGSLSGTVSKVTDATGAVTFGDLTLTRAGTKILQASAPGLVSTESGSFPVTPAAASQLVMLRSPTNAIAGASMTPSVMVAVQDTFGNAVPRAGIPVSLSVSAGIGSLAGATQLVTGADGVVTFNDLSMTAAGEKTLTATSTGLSSAISSAFTIVPAAYSRVQILVPGEVAMPGRVTGKTGAPVAQKIGATFTVAVNAVDDYWNVVHSVTNNVDLYSSDVRATLPPAAALVQGSQTFLAAFGTEGIQTLSAEDLVDDLVADDTTPGIDVATVFVTLRIATASVSASSVSNDYAYGTTLTNTVTSPDTRGGVQYVCTGWTLTGNAPFNGTNHTVVVTITNNCTLTWLWTTNYHFSATAGADGTITGTNSEWVPLGASIMVTGVPSLYHHFVAWSGDVPAGLVSSNPVTLVMTQARSVSAMFADTLAPVYGTPYTWMARYGFTNNMDAAELLMGSNGISLWQSYIADLNPTNANSLLRLQAVPGLPWGVSFGSSTGRVYTLERTTSLISGNGWSPVAGQTNVPGNGGVITLIDTNVASVLFHRVKVQLPQ